MVDANCRFLWVSGDAPGSMHDSAAFNGTALCTLLNQGRLPLDYHVAGDGAYTESDFMWTPFPEPRNGSLSQSKDTFNWIHSTHRQNVERAFGMLMGRWLVLETPLRIPHIQVHAVFTACCRLQNICITRQQEAAADDGMGEEEGGMARSFRPVQAAAGVRVQPPQVYMNTNPAPAAFSGLRARLRHCVRRLDIVQSLSDNGIVRPPGE
jgi:hypothetical protein